jgi:hypothetical protein
MEQTERSETSAHNVQTPGNYPEGIVQLVLMTFSCAQHLVFATQKNFVRHLYFSDLFQKNLKKHTSI